MIFNPGAAPIARDDARKLHRAQPLACSSRRVHQPCAKNSPGFSAAAIEHLANRARSAAAALLAEDVVFTKSTLPVG